MTTTYKTSIRKARAYAKELGVSHIKDRSLQSLIIAIEDCLDDSIDVKSIKLNMQDKSYTDSLMSDIMFQVSTQSGIELSKLLEV